ncbi:SGNH/GDSL hydrolase family protein, partial [Mesorhizobium sp. M2D.F.Ca.ET.148.01.1.1]
FAVLYKNSAGQRTPFVDLVAKSGGDLRTIICGTLQFGDAGILDNSGWMWATANGIPLDPDIDPSGYSFYLRVLPAFGYSVPTSNAPLYLQRIIAVEGDLPKGNLTG